MSRTGKGASGVTGLGIPVQANHASTENGDFVGGGGGQIGM